MSNKNKHMLPLKSYTAHMHSSVQTLGGRMLVFRDRLSAMTARHPRRTIGAAAGVVCMGIAGYGALLFWPQSVQYSLKGDTCITSPTVLPTSSAVQTTDKYATTFQPTLTIADITLYAHTVCVHATAAPTHSEAAAVRIQPLAGAPLSKELRIAAPAPATASYDGDPSKTISSRGTISYNLSAADETFGYHIAANSKTASCSKDGRRLVCAVTPLGLAQAVPYNIQLVRSFAGAAEPAALVTTKLTTVEPLQVVASSIGANQKVYDAPRSLTVTFNKPITTPNDTSLTREAGGKKERVETDVTVNGTTLTITWKSPLVRDAAFTLNAGTLAATDGAFLQQPYTLAFTTSGGPKVSHKNFGATRVSQSPSLTLTFDSDLLPGQDLKQFVQLSSDGGAIPFTLTSGKNSITLKPQSALGRCASFTVAIKDGLKNAAGISGGSAWSSRSRTLCQTSFSIGTSVQGRSINAYGFGSGSTKIVFVGLTHGNEKSSYYILSSFIDYLEDNPGVIPGDKTIVVVPRLNPDGFAANSRTNANNVDLNRNFPANNWKSGVVMPDKSYLATGGGTSALSEPESKAIASYIGSTKPRLVLTYHSKGSVVVPNGSGNSVSLAKTYGALSIVGYMPAENTGEFFEYDTTGAMEDWLHDAYGMPALLIELSTHTSNDFSGHRAAMLDAIKQ